MTAVAREAGVSKALLHYYFTTRQELLRSAFAWSEDQWRANLADATLALPTGAERLERVLLMSIDSDQRSLWNEVWSGLRQDDELRPVVDSSYRAWLERLRGLIEEGLGDGSIPASVDADEAAWRLAAVADGLESMLYLGLLGREQARELMGGSIRREVAAR